MGGIIGTHGWLPYDKSISNYFTFEKDPSVSNPKTRKKLGCPFAPGLVVDAKLFVVSHDAKLLFSGGHWDNSLQVYHLGKGRKVDHMVRHIDVVTCLSLDYCGSHLITGSRDTTCIVWQVRQQGGVAVGLAARPLQTLYGHDAEVTAVHVSIELDTAISASKDGTVMLHSVRKGHYMRTLRPPSEPSYAMNIPMLAVDDMGHIIVYCRETFAIDPKEVVSLHLYSLNGKHVKTLRIPHALGHMIIKGDNLLTGDVQGNLTVYEIFGSKAKEDLLSKPIHNYCLSRDDCLSLESSVLSIDMKTVQVSELEHSTAHFTFVINKGTSMHGFCTWFEAEFCPLATGGESVSLNTGPDYEITHWQQNLFLLDDPITVSKGDKVKGRIEISRNPEWRRHLLVLIKFTVLSGLQLDTEIAEGEKLFHVWR